MFLVLLLAFILGSAVGSFLNVVIDRSTSGNSITTPLRSYCDHCKATLKTMDLIPIISFVGLGAKCRYCKKPVSWQYPIVEGLTGLLFASSVYFAAVGNLFNPLYILYSFFLVSVLVIVSVVDMKFSLIPTAFVFFASLVALTYNFFTLYPTDFLWYVIAALGASLFFLFLVVATRGRGMGEGDIVLGLLIGMVLGVERAILAIFLAFFVGAAVSLVLIALRKKRFGQTVPFAPFLVLGFLTAFFVGEQIVSWYLMIH